jgi:hypothetical protein
VKPADIAQHHPATGRSFPVLGHRPPSTGDSGRVIQEFAVGSFTGATEAQTRKQFE